MVFRENHPRNVVRTWYHSVARCNRLVVRNGVEILVPLGERRRILETLHLDHTCDETMVRQCKGKLFWPKMRKQIKKLYNDSSSCTENRISRPQKTNQISYKNVFENFFPN